MLERKLNFKQIHHMKSLADLEGASGIPRPKSLHFHAVLGKNWSNSMLAPPRDLLLEGAPFQLLQMMLFVRRYNCFSSFIMLQNELVVCIWRHYSACSWWNQHGLRKHCSINLHAPCLHQDFQGGLFNFSYAQTCHNDLSFQLQHFFITSHCRFCKKQDKRFFK